MSNEEMALQIQQGETALYAELWQRNRPLLLKLADACFFKNRELLTRYGLEREDLQQVAFLALVFAVNRYRPENGYKLTSYFDISFKRELAAAFCGGERKSKTDALNMSGDLDEPVAEDSDTTLGELLPDEAAEQAFEDVDQADYDRQTAAVLWGCVNELPEPCRGILQKRYRDALSWGDIAEQAGIESKTAVAISRTSCIKLKRNIKIRRAFPERYHVRLSGAGAETFFHTGASIVERTVEWWEQLDEWAQDKKHKGE